MSESDIINKLILRSEKAKRRLDRLAVQEIFNFGGMRDAAAYAHASSSKGFIEAINSLGGNDGVIYLSPANYTITSNYTVPTNAHLLFAKGAYCTISNAVTLTIDGTIEAGLWQIFVLTGTGVVTFPSPYVVSTEWWGTGTNALGAAVVALLDGGTVEITNDITQASGITIPATLATRKGTRIKGTRPWVRIDMSHTVDNLFTFVPAGAYRVLKVEFENLLLHGPGATSGGAIYVDGSTYFVLISMRNVRIEEFGGGTGIYAKEIYFSDFIHVIVNACDCSIHLEDAANANHFYDVCARNGTGTYAVRIENVTSIGWFGGDIEGNQEHGLYLEGVGQAMFSQIHFEQNNLSAIANRYAVYLNSINGNNNSQIRFDACRFADTAVLRSQIYMTGVLGFANTDIFFIGCRHMGNDGNQVVINGTQNKNIQFIGGFDPARIANANNCPVYMQIWDAVTDLLSFPSFLGNKHLTHGTAAPAANTWAIGDRQINTTPEVGQSPMGWANYAAGTPGEWASVGQLYFGPSTVQAAATGGADTFIVTVTAGGVNESLMLDFEIIGHYGDPSATIAKRIIASCGLQTNVIRDTASVEVASIGDAKNPNLTLSAIAAVGANNQIAFTFTNTDVVAFGGHMRTRVLTYENELIAFALANNQ